MLTFEAINERSIIEWVGFICVDGRHDQRQCVCVDNVDM